MIHILPSDECQLIQKVCEDCLILKISNVGYILYNDQQPVGIAFMTVHKEVSELKALGIVCKERGKGYGDFFTRSLMSRLCDVSSRLVINSTSPYFEKFNFKRENDKMTINSVDIKFPKKCEM